MERKGRSQDPLENGFPYFSVLKEMFFNLNFYSTFCIIVPYVSYFHVDWALSKTRTFDLTPAQLQPLSKYRIDLVACKLLEFSVISLSKQKSKIT